jgi:uncharacterized membrane protein YphA (DoxX/SURF4 family)
MPHHQIEDDLRHSFSAFPDGWPGQGLLLLRVTVGLPLVYWGSASLTALGFAAIPHFAAAVAGILLISGLHTAIAGAVIVLAEAWMLVSPASGYHAEPWPHIFLAALSASVAMLGPGAWSVDARRFGRKVFEIGESRGRHS